MENVKTEKIFCHPDWLGEPLFGEIDFVRMNFNPKRGCRLDVTLEPSMARHLANALIEAADIVAKGREAAWLLCVTPPGGEK